MDLENDRRGTWWKGNVRGRGSVGAVSSRSYSVCRIAKIKSSFGDYSSDGKRVI